MGAHSPRARGAQSNERSRNEATITSGRIARQRKGLSYSKRTVNMNRYNLPKTGRAIGWIMATVIIVIATYSAAAWITADAWPLTVFRAPYAWRWRTSFGTTWLAF